MTRRLAAILAADIVRYSALMAEDEAGTLESLRRLRRELYLPAVAEHRGKVIKNLGDGWLIEFASALDAVTCALRVQDALTAEPHIRVRMGIHLGDITHEEEDIFGDGVNIAARLEALAEPGAVAISDAVFGSLDGTLRQIFDDTGEQGLKNLPRPVRVWRRTAPAGASASADSSDTASVSPSPSSPPEKPSIAILPFVNMSDDTEQAYFADGLTEDIITALSRATDLFVCSRTSTFAYRDANVEVRQIGRELGVRYVLEGSVRRSGQRLRVTAQLIEAESGNHVWADRYDGIVDDLFDMQDEITGSVAGTVLSEIGTHVLQQVVSKDIRDLRSWDRYVKASWLVAQFNKRDNLEGCEICRQEIRDGHQSYYRILANGLAQDMLYNYSGRGFSDIVSEAEIIAQRAIEYNNNDANSFHTLSMVYFYNADHDNALDAARTVVRINPNNPYGPMMVGCVLAWSGAEHYASATKILNKALKLAPRGYVVPWIHYQLATAALVSDRYDEAVKAARTAIRQNPFMGNAHRHLTAALALSGRIDEAREAWKRAVEVQPLDVEAFSASMRRVFRQREDAEKYLHALRLAGMPEGDE